MACCGFRGVFSVGRDLFVLSMSLHFQIRRPRAVSVEGAPTASQSAHPRELAPTYPHHVYRLVCSHLRNMASAVVQYSSSQPNQEASLIFDPTNATSTSFFQALSAPVAIARDTEDSGRRTHEGYRGMCCDPVDPGGEVRGCFAGCAIAVSGVSPFVWIQLAGPCRVSP